MAARGEDSPAGAAPVGLASFVRYFLGLGIWGFGGPAALVGFMHRDLVERRRWVDAETYRLALALAQLMPGPLAAQTAIALGYFHRGVLGASLVGLAFILPSFLMVVTISMLYVAYGGLWWMQAAFYGVGAAVIAVIAVAAARLARATNKRDPLLWAIFAATAAVTTWAQAELAEAFLLAGLVTLLAKAPPRWLRERLPFLSHGLAPLALPALPPAQAAAGADLDRLWQILLFFAKAGAFVFGSGLAIVPFLYNGVVREYGWLTDQQFLDAVAVAMITPGPVVITVAFIGYLAAGLPGAVAAAAGIFLPVYLLTIVPAPWFKRHRDHPQLKAFVLGATAAATGAIAGAVVVLGLRTLVDLPTALIALVSLGSLWRFRLPEPALVAAAGLVGLVVWPLVRGLG
jgi:chromate transporter